ncbi:MAG: response regulator transcription factor [Solirubrobacterales bacterium]|nr:response regulator transcription factor [Solirubrobacterales bacterium]
MILVVEDEPGILDFIERGLRRQGLEVITATDGATGLELARDPKVRVVVLDLMLPQLSGGEVLARLQPERPDLPVIVLTARGDLEDRIAGLDAGAVDYLVKPFSLDELAARVRAQLRMTEAGETQLQSGAIKIDLISREVTVSDQPVRLSTTEFELLLFLMRNQGKVVERDQALRAVWGYNHDPGTNVLDVYVGYLRRKLSAAGAEQPITTIRSLGYRFDGDGS